MNRVPSNALVWFGVLGGSVAWATQFLANLAFSFAACDAPGRWHLPVHAWVIGLSVAAILVGLASTGTAAFLYRRTVGIGDIAREVREGYGGRPPEARVHFLAIVGLTVNALSLMIVVLTGIGGPLITVCRQS